MAEWRVGRKLGVTLYRDEVFVGHVCSPELAAEIVEAMEVRQRVADRAAENARERSRESWECPAETWSWWHFTDQQVDAYWIRCTLLGRHDEHEDANTGLCWRTGERPRAEQPVDAQRRSEATPQNDLLGPSRVDPYDTRKGGVVDG